MCKFLLMIAVVLLVAGCSQENNSASTISESTDVVESTRVSYNPELCKTDAEGMVYFSLGRGVFRRPYEEAMSIMSMPDIDKSGLPPRPDSNEPEGCFENPISGMSFSIGYQHEAASPENYPEGTPFRVEQMRFLALPQRAINSTSEVGALKYGNQLSWERSYERVKNNYNTCEIMSNGLEACFVPNDERKEMWTVKFQADMDIYIVPFDRPFTVNCLAWSIIVLQNCNVSYNYIGDTRIFYDFTLQDLPALEIIEFDKGLRVKIESMRVSNYVWADE